MNFIKKVSLTVSLIFCAGAASAVESRFIANQKQNLGLVDLNIGFVNASDSLNARTEKWQSYELVYNRTLMETHQFSFGANFLNREITYDNSGEFHRITGLRGFSLNYKGGVVYEPATLIFGINTQVSPGSKRDPLVVYDGNRNLFYKESGNNFEGYSSFAPFVGVETYLDQAAFTAKAFMEGYTATKANERIYGISANFELPITKSASAGVELAVARPNGDPFKMIGGEADNQYKSKIFASYALDTETKINGSISGENRTIPVVKDETVLQIGLSRNL
jgi:hypothetical protein